MTGANVCQVLLKYLNKVAVSVECAMDGVQCTDKVFDHPHGYYSLILVCVPVYRLSSG
jgi:hypothetical protein